MKLLKLFTRKAPDTAAAARAMAKAGVDRRRARIRARTESMRQEAGLPPARWPS